MHGLSVSHTDFCDLHRLTGVRCNPYGYLRFLQIHTYNHSTLYIRTVVSLQWHQLCFVRWSMLPLLTRERNVLFNDALNTFYLWLYGVRHMVKDHSDSEKGNLLPPHRLLLSINSKGSFICTIPQTYTTAFVTPVVEHWLEREIAQWVHPMKDWSNDPSHHERTLYLWATSRSLLLTTESTKINDLWHNKLCFVCYCIWVCYSGILCQNCAL